MEVVGFVWSQSVIARFAFQRRPLADIFNCAFLIMKFVEIVVITVLGMKHVRVACYGFENGQAIHSAAALFSPESSLFKNIQPCLVKPHHGDMF